MPRATERFLMMLSSGGRQALRAMDQAAEAAAEVQARQLGDIKNQYDALSNEGIFKRSRRRPTIERDTEEADQLTGYKRLESIADARDLQRNFSAVSGLMLQYVRNVIGTGPKLHMNTADEGFNQRAANFFNRVWARECDARGERHLATLLALELQAVLREGDILQYFDRVGLADNPSSKGQVWYWEADQLVNVSRWSDSKAEVAERLHHNGRAADLIQMQGVICDAFGRPIGYSVHSEYAKTEAPLDKVTILPAADAKLLMDPWRLGQWRGTSALLPVVQDLQDLRRFRFAVIQRAIVQAHLALKVKSSDPDRLGCARVTTNDNGAHIDVETADLTDQQKRYRQFERIATAVEYMNPEDDVEAMQLSGDSQEFSDLSEAVAIAAGYGMGVTRLHSQGKADASYSASRAEGNIDERGWKCWQKWLERESLDWKARRILGMEIDEGRLPAVQRWTSYSWSGWPKPMSLNPQQEINAKQTELATGLTDYSRELGPDWKAHVDALAEQVAYFREKGINLESFDG